MLPENFSIFGFARSKMTDDEFREYIQGSLSCRLTNKEECGDKMADFLKRCFYQPGQYKEQNDFQKLSDRMSEIEGVGALSLSSPPQAALRWEHSALYIARCLTRLLDAPKIVLNACS